MNTQIALTHHPQQQLQPPYCGSHLPTKVARVLAVLRDFNLLHHLTQRGAVPGAVLTDNADLLRSFRLQNTKGVQGALTGPRSRGLNPPIE